MSSGPDQIRHPKAPDASWLIRAVLAIVLIRAIVVTSAVISVNSADVADLDRTYATGTALVAWDSNHYRRILAEGYPSESIQPIIAFFPGYPLLAWPLDQLISPELALLAMANACSLAGLLIMFLWSRELVGDRIAFIATTLAASFPPAMFLVAAYVQGPMLLAVSLTLWMSRRSHWWTAGLASGLATALHPTGIAMSATLGLLMLCRKVSWTRWLPIIVLSGSGLLAYQGFLWTRYERFDAYLRAQDHWDVSAIDSNRTSVPPTGVVATQSDAKNEPHSTSLAEWLPEPLQKLASLGAWNKLWLIVMMALSVVGLVRPGPIPRELFALPIIIFLLGYLPGQGARVTSIARLETVAVPCFVIAASIVSNRRWSVLAVVAVLAMTLMQSWYAFAFSRGEWAG